MSVPGRFDLSALDPGEAAAVLRAAHAWRRRYAKASGIMGRRVFPPWWVLSLERDYQAWRKRAQRSARAAA